MNPDELIIRIKQAHYLDKFDLNKTIRIIKEVARESVDNAKQEER